MFDLRVRFDVIVFSILLLLIVNLKLGIHGLRTSDIQLLHKEYYFVSMSESDAAKASAKAKTLRRHRSSALGSIAEAEGDDAADQPSFTEGSSMHSDGSRPSERYLGEREGAIAVVVHPVEERGTLCLARDFERR